MGKLRLFIIVVVVGTIILTAGYFFGKKFQRDRQAGLALPANSTTIEHLTPQGTREVKTYTAQELEEARKKGKLPAGMRQPYMPPIVNPGEAAAERSLRTVEEINRINQMNQRMMEQQQRANRQNNR